MNTLVVKGHQGERWATLIQDADGVRAEHVEPHMRSAVDMWLSGFLDNREVEKWASSGIPENPGGHAFFVAPNQPDFLERLCEHLLRWYTLQLEFFKGAAAR